jgi:hypothetical protein
MGPPRKLYPSDVTDEEWEHLLPHLTLVAMPANEQERAQVAALAREVQEERVWYHLWTTA